MKKRSRVRFDDKHIRLRTGESQRDNGTYIYRWTDNIGKRHAIYAPTLEQLRIEEKQVIVDKHDGVRSDIKSVTANDMFDLWRQLKRGIKDSTFKNYIYMYEMFIKPDFGRKRIVSLKKSDVRRFYISLMEDKGLKLSTVDGIHNVLYQVLQDAVDDNMIRANPAAGVMRELKLVSAPDAQRREALTIEQQKLLFDYLLKSPRYLHWYPVFFIMANTGLRVGEITGLRWQDIDIAKGMIYVTHTLVYYNHQDDNGCYFSINTPKTIAGHREIPMTEAVKKAFEMEREYQALADLHCESHIDGYDNFIFINRFGKVQGQSTLNKALRRIIRDCNLSILDKHTGNDEPVLLPHFSCHHLRHTFATRLCEAGLNIKVIQSILGHADIATTMDIYISVSEDFKKKEVETFGEYMRQGVNKVVNL